MIYRKAARFAKSAAQVIGVLALFPGPLAHGQAVDPSFNAVAGYSNNFGGHHVNTIVPHPEGGLLVGGAFHELNGASRGRIGRLSDAGVLDAGFTPTNRGTVNAVLVHPDGGILLGRAPSSVDADAVSGFQRPGLARLFMDGDVDGFYWPIDSGRVNALALQPDGKILVGGSFGVKSDGSWRRIARFSADGTQVDSFDGSANDQVNGIALQYDGQILVCGNFTEFAGQPRSHLVRLTPDGTLDPTFTPMTNSWVHSVMALPDGKILICGSFTRVNDRPRRYFARLHADGSLDETFDPSPSNWVHTMALQADGRILIGGRFTHIGDHERARIARLHPDGTVDESFTPGANGHVNAITLRPDGRILVGGDFTQIGGLTRYRLALLENDPATSSLGVTSGQIKWTVEGTAPEMRNVYFEALTGSEWVRVGDAVRVADGWLADGLSLPSAAWYRARGTVSGGLNNGSSWLMEARRVTTRHPPEIHATANGGPLVHRESVVDFGSASWKETGATITLTITNTGRTTLESLSLGLRELTPVEFVIGELSATTLAPSESATFDVTFTPFGGGLRQANLAIASNDGRITPIEIRLTGTGIQADASYQPEHNVSLNAIARQPDGKLLINGLRTTINGVTRSRLARLMADGTIDPAFVVDHDNFVSHLAVRPNGDILVGGSFYTIQSQPRVAIARLRNDGSLDPDFDPNPNGFVNGIVPQPNGKILIFGTFSKVGEVLRQGFARLHDDGTLDASFAITKNGPIHAVAIQPDGKILIGGNFTSVHHQPRPGLARLNADGSLDSDFAPPVSGTIGSIALQPDGKILIAPRLARLHPDGSLDQSFFTSFNLDVESIALQADGKILVGGGFRSVGPLRRNALARLHANGAIDDRFDPNADGLSFAPGVRSILPELDGSLLVAGSFLPIGGLDRAHLALLQNDPGRIEIEQPASDELHLLASGAAPVFNEVAAQLWQDGEWVDFDIPERIPNGWRLVSSELPASGTLRFLCSLGTGSSHGNTSIHAITHILGASNPAGIYHEWSVLEDLPLDRRAATDTNGPLGLQNLLAYAMGLHPLSATAADMPMVTGAAEKPGHLIIRFRRNIAMTDAQLIVTTSSSLAADSWTPATIHQQMVVESGVGWELLEAELEAPHPKQAFFRLEAFFAE